jgi:hypothetical protein
MMILESALDGKFKEGGQRRQPDPIDRDWQEEGSIVNQIQSIGHKPVHEGLRRS